MKRTSRSVGPRRRALFCVLVLLAGGSCSGAAARTWPRPLGVTVRALPTPPSARIGALFHADGSDWEGGHFCTASVVHSPHRDLVVTAAHCLSDEGDGDVVFVPGYRYGKTPYGVWPVQRMLLPDGWSDGRSEDSDVAFAVLGRQGGRNVEDVVGANRFVTGTATGASTVTVTGYPDDQEAPVVCTNKPVRHSPTQQRINCPGFSSGTSGSPWVDRLGRVVGVLGGHEDGGDTDDVSYSVVLGAEAAESYRDATGAR
ncbi:trypsin-like peptidase domain-containing protein [Streptomyces sp. NPDC014805]|uniref:trypsin-like peptidase domain-containing protein n=1 Tax=Streptomyces sp. NPDC014805 TaxID=3364919 RepID=UPI0036FCE6A5